MKRSVYYICPQRDGAGSSCPNKSKSESKLKKQVFCALSDKIKQLGVDYHDILAYEKSPYFLRKMAEQDKLILTYGQEIVRQFQLFKQLYEESVSNHTIRSADTQGLLRHLEHVRTSLQERMMGIVRSRDNYQANESSGSEKFRPYHMFCECNELIPQVLDEMVGKVFVDFDGVRVTWKETKPNNYVII